MVALRRAGTARLGMPRCCSSCCGRRMAEGAADLTDRILPRVPVRQWVLTLPHRLRYPLAWDHDLCRAALAVYVRALLGFYRRRARAAASAAGAAAPSP